LKSGNVDRISQEFARGIKGFLAEDEGMALFNLALQSAVRGPCLEVGSYCGKSAYYLGTACQLKGATLFSIDHHRGSEEQQPGQPYYDPDLFDEKTGGINSLPALRQTLKSAGLEHTVVPMVTTSQTASRDWKTPLSLVFIDGGHSYQAVCTDYECWRGHLMPGGYLVFHDIYPDPAMGGQAPYEVYKSALSAGDYAELPMVGSLGILKDRRAVVVKKQVGG